MDTHFQLQEEEPGNRSISSENVSSRAEQVEALQNLDQLSVPKLENAIKAKVSQQSNAEVAASERTKFTLFTSAAIQTEMRKALGLIDEKAHSDFDSIFGPLAQGMRDQIYGMSKIRLKYELARMQGDSLWALKHPAAWIGATASAIEMINLARPFQLEATPFAHIPSIIGGICLIAIAQSLSTVMKPSKVFQELTETGVNNLTSDPSLQARIGFSKPELLRDNPDLERLLSNALIETRSNSTLLLRGSIINSAIESVSEVYPEMKAIPERELRAAADFLFARIPN